MTKIRLGIWLDIDTDEAKKEMLDDDELTPADITKDDVIDYLTNRMIEDINTMAINDELQFLIRCEEIQ